MRGWITAGLVALAYVIQTSLLAPLSLWGVRPDLILVLVCLIALHFGWWQGALAGFFAGLFVDLVEGHLIGLGALSKAIAGGGVGWMGQNVFGGNALVPVMVVASGSLIEHAVYLVGMWGFGLHPPFLEGLLRVVLPSAWYNALAAAILAPFIASILRRVALLGKDPGLGVVDG